MRLKSAARKSKAGSWLRGDHWRALKMWLSSSPEKVSTTKN